MPTRLRDEVPDRIVVARTSATAAWAESGRSVPLVSANGTRRRSSTIGTSARRTATTRRPEPRTVSTSSGAGTERCGPSGGRARGPVGVLPISSALRRSVMPHLPA